MLNIIGAHLIGLLAGGVGVAAGHYLMNWADARWRGFSMPPYTEAERREMGL